MNDTAQKIIFFLIGGVAGALLYAAINPCPSEACIYAKEYQQGLANNVYEGQTSTGAPITCTGSDCESLKICTVPPPSGALSANEK